ncbi:undecaprenyl pyrophosphate synthase [uncultured Desulfobacterium sp.]|uniref:Isoprenyl transferase n=1 Tax=uncultured Desulfobacterium sp. TaxID=201089 RepID=A0A445N222_9BACT|nr:undecaprenyl pyrophosphate synthase [uncultured Desulfobacterium sp.]
MTSIDPANLPKHIAIIMDGNGRWAKKRLLNRIEGHKKGTDAVRNIVRASREIGIEYLTLYAFSEENWKRPKSEVSALMTLLKEFLISEFSEMQENGIRLNAIGRTEKLPEAVRKTLSETITKTSSNRDMVLTLALSYGGRQEIADSVKRIAFLIEKGDISVNEVTEDLISGCLYTAQIPDPDLLIRTSGEYRISNFLLWQIAYTELYITPTLWPDFGKDEYLAAIADFQGRERRFGGT